MPSRWLFGGAAPVLGLVVVVASGCGGGGSDQTPLIDTAPISTSTSPGGNLGSSGEPSSDADGGEAGAGSGGAGACAGGSTAAGCPCTTPGQTVACGQVHRVTGDYVSCSPGTQTCDVNMTWGACLGDRVGAP
jgi:hypothetical protein